MKNSVGMFENCPAEINHGDFRLLVVCIDDLKLGGLNRNTGVLFLGVYRKELVTNAPKNAQKLCFSKMPCRVIPIKISEKNFAAKNP